MTAQDLPNQPLSKALLNFYVLTSQTFQAHTFKGLLLYHITVFFNLFLSVCYLSSYQTCQWDVPKDTMLLHDTPWVLGSHHQARSCPWLSHMIPKSSLTVPVPSGNILLSRPTVSMSSKKITPLMHGRAPHSAIMCFWN